MEVLVVSLMDVLHLLEVGQRYVKRGRRKHRSIGNCTTAARKLILPDGCYYRFNHGEGK